MDSDAIRDAFFECQEVKEVEGGKLDDQGFYRLPGGDFYDPDGVYFNKEGKDKYGGYYDEEFIYHAGQEYLDLVKAIEDEHCLLEQYGLEEADACGIVHFEGEGEGEGEVEEEVEEEVKEFKDEKEWEDYLYKEKINPTLAYIKENPDKRYIFISFKGMSDNKDDAKAYFEWFKERGVKPIDVAINASRLNVRITTSDEESIINAIKLEGTPDVDLIKVYLPFLSTEKVGVKDEDDDEIDDAPAVTEDTPEDLSKQEAPKEEKKVEDEENEFEIREGV